MSDTVAHQPGCRKYFPWRSGTLTYPRRHRERGIAAVELALLLPVLVSMLALTMFFGRVLWHYTAAQKAAHDAARYMSTVPLTDMHWTRIEETVNVADQILDEELGELNPGEIPVSSAVRCDDWECNGLTTPTTVSVRVQMRMSDPIFGTLTQAITGNNSLLLTAIVTMPYSGR